MMDNSITPYIKVWKSLISIGYSNYEISSYGKFRNIKTSKLLKDPLSGGKYYKYNIIDKNINKKTVNAHQLVVLIFIESSPRERIYS